MPKIAVAGLTHGHVWGLIESFRKVDGVELVAVADATPLLDRARDSFARTYVDWREMLDKESLDGLVVTSDNAESTEISIAALERGIPCLVEKAMAASAVDADRMLAAQQKSGKTLMINWPFAWSPWLHDLKHRIEAGEIGQVFHLRFRNGHHGPKEIGCDEYFVGWLYDEAKNGGGAIADFGSYGAALARWYFGMPESVFCIRHNATKDYEVSDDHAILLLKYPKMTVQIEGTWATNGFDSGSNCVVHGSEGTLAAHGDKLEHAKGWSPKEFVECPPLATTSPAEYFLACIGTGNAPDGVLNPQISADACRILDAAKKSSKSGCLESL